METSAETLVDNLRKKLANKSAEILADILVEIFNENSGGEFGRKVGVTTQQNTEHVVSLMRSAVFLTKTILDPERSFRTLQVVDPKQLYEIPKQTFLNQTQPFGDSKWLLWFLKSEF